MVRSIRRYKPVNTIPENEEHSENGRQKRNMLVSRTARAIMTTAKQHDRLFKRSWGGTGLFGSCKVREL
jgi:hypothetical protein